LNIFFSSIGLTIFASKSEVMLFTRKLERPPILVRIGSYVLPLTTYFKYLGIFIDAGLRWSCHVKYVRQRCRCFLGCASILFDTAVMGTWSAGGAEHLSLHQTIFRCFIIGYSSSESFTRHKLPALPGTPLLDGHMKKQLVSVQEAMYSLVALRELLTVTLSA
jgi:hypothetical protein